MLQGLGFRGLEFRVYFIGFWGYGFYLAQAGGQPHDLLHHRGN